MQRNAFRGHSTKHKCLENFALYGINKSIIMIEKRVSNVGTVHQMYAESNVTSCICHKLGICTLTNPSVGDVIYQESRLHHPHLDGLIDYITHTWMG